MPPPAHVAARGHEVKGEGRAGRDLRAAAEGMVKRDLRHGGLRKLGRSHKHLMPAGMWPAAHKRAHPPGGLEGAAALKHEGALGGGGADGAA